VVAFDAIAGISNGIGDAQIDRVDIGADMGDKCGTGTC
jgi:hypothetical protein